MSKNVNKKNEKLLKAYLEKQKKNDAKPSVGKDKDKLSRT
jgi:hypothetical protein